MGRFSPCQSRIKSAPIRLYVPLLRHALRAGFAVRFGILPSQSGTFSREREKGKSGGSGSYGRRRRRYRFPASTHRLIQPLQHLQ